MKILRLFFFALSLVFIFSACNKRHILGIVQRNCTGTYIEFGERYYKVSNKEKLEPFQTGETVEVSFRRSNDSFNDEEIICMLAIEYESVIEILSVH